MLAAELQCEASWASPNDSAEQGAVPVQNPGNRAPNSCHQLPQVGQCQAFPQKCTVKGQWELSQIAAKKILDTWTKMFTASLIKD